MVNHYILGIDNIHNVGPFDSKVVFFTTITRVTKVNPGSISPKRLLNWEGPFKYQMK